MEGRLQTDSIEDLQLEPCWTAVRCERFGQVGSMPVNKWFPWLMIEDRKNGVFWGAQIAHNASWQMEIYRAGDALAISGGLADADFGHWSKDLQPGEQLTTPQAILTVCTACDVDEASQRLTSGQIRAINAGPASEQELPVMFNEYCTTWGCPSQQNAVHLHRSGYLLLPLLPLIIKPGVTSFKSSPFPSIASIAASTRHFPKY